MKQNNCIILKPFLFILVCSLLAHYFGWGVVPSVIAAEQTLRVSPVILTIPLSPGKIASQEATIENLSTHPLPLTASLNDFITSGEEGGYIFEESKENPLLSWITLSENNFILNPKEKKKVHITIKTPQRIPVGGYYGILFFEPIPQHSANTRTQINSKVGILMLANLGVPDPHAKKAEILAFTPDMFSQDGSVPFMLRVKNVSLNFFTAKPILTVSPLIKFSHPEKPLFLEEKIIFPGKIRRWTQANTIQNLSPNIYKAHIVVDVGNGQVENEDQYFIVFPYLTALIASFILFIVIFVLAKIKRLKDAVAALFRP